MNLFPLKDGEIKFDHFTSGLILLYDVYFSTNLICNIFPFVMQSEWLPRHIQVYIIEIVESKCACRIMVTTAFHLHPDPPLACVGIRRISWGTSLAYKLALQFNEEHAALYIWIQYTVSCLIDMNCSTVGIRYIYTTCDQLLSENTLRVWDFVDNHIWGDLPFAIFQPNSSLIWWRKVPS